MKKNLRVVITSITLLAALTMLVRLAAQEPQNESATTVAANPVPLINQPLVPDAIRPGAAGFTLTINGTGFVSGSVVKWNGSARATTFVSASRLTAIILASDIVKPTTARVTVVNPAPGGGTSNTVFLEVTIPAASIGMTTSFFNAGSTPWALAAGDFNGDGELDLAVANLYGSDVSVFLGRGDGTFEPAVNYSISSDPYSVAVGDFNGDGKLDLAVVNDGSNSVSLLLGKGDGTFQTAVNYGTGPQPTSVAVGDFNRDGKLDLAVTNLASDSVSVLLGNGNGTFQTAVNYGTGPQPTSVAVGDFNGDGTLDLAVANKFGDNVSILLGNGDGTFRSPVNYGAGSAPESVAVGDFNRDGKLDLVVANSDSNNLSVLLGKGDGTFQAAANYATGSPQSVVVGDSNGDGNLDLIVGAFGSNAVSVLFGKGDGTFMPAINFANSVSPVAVTVGDFNSDGRLDVAGIGGTLAILLQAPVAALSKPSLNFPIQLTGTSSSPQTVALTNIGALALNINSIAVTGANATDFTQTRTCGSSLPPAASCTISVVFKPTQIGPRTASVVITDSAVGSPQVIPLSGTGVVSGPNATLSRTNLSFSAQPLGTTSTQSVTLGNYGTVSLGITGFAITGVDLKDFAQTNTCGSSLAAGASCTISVTFKPTKSGTRTGTLSITDNGPGSPQTVSLSGTGTDVELSPTSLKFACITEPIGHCTCFVSKTITLTNVGSTTLNISGITISGPFSQTNTCGASVAAGSSCNINVTWSRSTGEGAVSISDNGGASPQTQTVSLFGNKLCGP